ncbi:hypothetical protein M413DRAFT_24776 [Hebeloma cylindrosporum]|uniref:Protein kinase domain-containing protein n=1 Tax=Hebeloma cylindrosporum TaxID=76867 RepID=A0A0C3CNI2_HEBCY|nr:hypothetical protein M413DRAFT_24776 [Hebeloma cylindrosporum h7]
MAAISPIFPPELEREIFEVAVHSNKNKRFVNFMLVARRVHDWIASDIYCIASQLPQNSFPPRKWGALTTSVEYFGPFVKHLIIGGPSWDHDSLAEFFEACHTVADLALWTHIPIRELRPVLERLSLKRLSANLTGLDFEDLTNSIFASITHLDITRFDRGPHIGWPQWRAFTHLTFLTHLAINEPMDDSDEIIQNLLRGCQRLRILLIIEVRDPWDLKDVPFGDPRLVFMKIQRYVCEDWVEGAKGNEDIWRCAEEISRAKHYGFSIDPGADIPREPIGDLYLRALKCLRGQESLHDAISVSEIFPNGPPPNTLHIVVCDSEILAMGPLLSFHKKLHENVGTRFGSLIPNYSPSDIIGSVAKVNEVFGGINPRIYLGRPSGAPAAIFNWALATLQHRLDHLEEVQVAPQDIGCAAKYLNVAIEFYDDERVRENAIKESIDVALGEEGSWNTQLNWADGIKPRCGWWHKGFLTTLLELKNTVGLAGNPILQAVIGYGKIISQTKYKEFRDFCNFPVVLIGVAENRIDIAIAVCLGDIHVTNLLTLDLTAGFLASDSIVRLARVFRALSSCRKDLALYYNQVAQKTIPRLSSLFPNPTLINPSVVIPGLTYKRFLSRVGQPTSGLVDLNAATALYIATMDGTDKEVVVKFTGRYNETAHRILAIAGLAPELHFCQPVIGGLYMVVMDRVDGKSLCELQANEIPIPSIVALHVHQALALLHAQDLVFGDLQLNNILYDASKDQTHIVDFDWPGKHKVSRYPATLNSDKPWHDDVLPYGIMDKAHDLWLLKRLDKHLLQDFCSFILPRACCRYDTTYYSN